MPPGCIPDGLEPHCGYCKGKRGPHGSRASVPPGTVSVPKLLLLELHPNQYFHTHIIRGSKSAVQFLFKNVSMCCTYMEDARYKEEGNTQAGRGSGTSPWSLLPLHAQDRTNPRVELVLWFSLSFGDGFTSRLLTQP